MNNVLFKLTDLNIEAFIVKKVELKQESICGRPFSIGFLKMCFTINLDRINLFHVPVYRKVKHKKKQSQENVSSYQYYDISWNALTSLSDNLLVFNCSLTWERYFETLKSVLYELAFVVKVDLCQAWRQNFVSYRNLWYHMTKEVSCKKFCAPNT